MQKNPFEPTISVLKKYQKNDGTFESFSYPINGTRSHPQVYSTTFINAWILICLAPIKHAALEPIKLSLRKFLLKEKSDFWSWNYWSRSSNEYTKLPLPDDLDDTMVSLIGLYLNNPEDLTGSSLSQVIELLTSLELAEGGPYKTWILQQDPERKWQDLDLAVNINIAWFLSLLEISLPSLEGLVEDAIENDRFHSAYYPTSWPIIFSLAKWYQGEKKEKLIKYIIAQKKETFGWGNQQNDVLALTALLAMGVSLKELSEDLVRVRSIVERAGFTQVGFCCDPQLAEHRYLAGSPALSAAFYLSLEWQVMQKKQAEKKTKSTRNDKSREHVEGIKKKLISMSGEFQADAERFLRKVLAMEEKHLVLSISDVFFYSLKKEDQALLSDETLSTLKIAQIYGWMAYTAYDECFDQHVSMQYISVANWCLREFIATLREILSTTQLRQICSDLINKIEQAHYLEITAYRLPKTDQGYLYDSLSYSSDGSKKVYDRALGYAVGPLSVLLLLDVNPTDKNYQQFMLFFREYLIARQMHDDAHDWQEDLEAGRLTPINLEMLELFAKSTNKKMIRIEIESISQLHAFFWQQYFPRCIKQIQKHLDNAMTHLNEVDLINQNSIFFQLITRLQHSTDRTQGQRKAVLEFLATYKEEK